MPSTLVIRSEQTEQNPITRPRYISRFYSESERPSLREIKMERIRKDSKRIISISSRRAVRVDSDGQRRIYMMEFHPPERRLIETNPNENVTEYTFNFSRWKELAKTNRLGAKLLYFYYRDIFGDPKKQSMGVDYLEYRYDIPQKEIIDIILKAKKVVCSSKLLSNEM